MKEKKDQLGFNIYDIECDSEMSIERMIKSPSKNSPMSSPFSALKMNGLMRQDSSSALSQTSDTYSMLKEKLSSRTPHIKVNRGNINIYL